MKKFTENNMEISYKLPKSHSQILYMSAPFKITKYLIDYLMGYRKNVFVYSEPQAGKTKMLNYLEQ